MSNLVYPNIRGRSMESTRVPEWSTIRQLSVSGKELTIGLWANPIWHYDLKYEYIIDEDTNLFGTNDYSDLNMVFGFYMARQGSYDTWLYDDPDDDSVSGQVLGVGDGVNRQFQLVRDLGGFLEAIQNINGSPTIYNSGVPSGALLINSTGLVTFTVAPLAGHIITADFNFYFRCRFEEDKIDFNKFAYNLFEAKTVKFKTVKL